jgi:hypothetical protein
MPTARAATLAAVLVASVAASPAGAVTGGYGVAKALHSGRGTVVAATAMARDDKTRSCQAGDHKARSTTQPALAGDIERKAAAVACEQPPRSNLITPDAIAKATASALATLG